MDLIIKSQGRFELNSYHDQRHTPKYHWVYRPELSFSVVDIQVNDILLKEHNDNTSTSQSVLDNHYPVITGQEDLVEVLFSLISSEYDRITPLEGERQYIFALGDHEIEVRIDKSDNNQEQQIRFSNLEYLTNLKASDYLTLSLYLNQDSHNLLWNWAFTTLDVDLDEDNDNGTDLPDRSLLEEQIEAVLTHSGKRNFLNNGDVNNNGIPDFAEFEYTILPEQLDLSAPQGRSATPQINQLAEHHFVPIVVEIPTHVDVDKDTTTIRFYYQGSDPEIVHTATDKDGIKSYTPAEGNMRLWAKDAHQPRNPKSYQRGGDYLEPNHAYTLLDLLKSNHGSVTKRTFVIYAEAIRATENRGAVLTTVLSYEHRTSNGATVTKEERSMNGLTNLEKPFQAVAALPQDTNLDLAYSVDMETTPPQPQITLYTIGGVRLKLTYNLNSLTAEDRSRLNKITWSFNQGGWMCEDLKILKDNKKANGEMHCTELAANAEHSTQGDKSEDHTLYWEPENWSNSLNALLTTKTHYKEGRDTMQSHNNGQAVTVPYPQITQTLAIKTRELAPQPAGQEYRGNDVKMLEQMLWQLGMSPDHRPFDTKKDSKERGKVGIYAERLNEGERNIFTTGVKKDNVGNMLSRLNYISSGPISFSNLLNNPTFMGAKDGSYKTIDVLKRHWDHYFQAYQNYTEKDSYEFANISNGDLEDILKVFDGGNIRYSSAYQEYKDSFTIKGTYTEDVHKKIKRYKSDFERIDLLKAFASKEVDLIHWGRNAQSHRITVGGSDERGSKGFNQILNSFSYGARSGTGNARNGSYCYQVTAYSISGETIVNHYDPVENLKAKAMFLAAERSDCGRSFFYAFGNHATNTYRAPISSQRILKLRKTGSVVDPDPNPEPKEKEKVNFYEDDAYELLAKGIGAYNQGIGSFNKTQSWIDTLINTKKGSKTAAAKAIEYALDILHTPARGIGLPYRTYIWKGGDHPVDLKDKDGNLDPKAGKEWCFVYGEKEWLAGAMITEEDGTERAKTFSDYRNEASLNDSLKDNCL